MRLIACADKNWGIGKGGALLVQIPQDMKYFKNTTINKVVVMGRRTLESFPGGRPLKDRVNIVLTKNADYSCDGATIVHSIDELMDAIKDYKADDVYCIGGAEVYRQLLPYCDLAYITRLDYSYEADAFLCDLGREPGWELIGESDEETYFNIPYTFCTYRRISDI